MKFISYWDNDDLEVKTYLLDIDVTAGNTVDCGEAIANSLTKIGICGLESDVAKLKGSSSDSGGAGTGDGLADVHEVSLIQSFTLWVVLSIACSCS